MENNSEDSDDAAMKDALKRVGSSAREAAFKVGKPVVVEEHGQLVWLFSDGTTKPYRPDAETPVGPVGAET